MTGSQIITLVVISGMILIGILATVLYHVRGIVAMRTKGAGAANELEARLARLEAELAATKEIVHQQAIEMDNLRAIGPISEKAQSRD